MKAVSHLEIVSTSIASDFVVYLQVREDDIEGKHLALVPLHHRQDEGWKVECDAHAGLDVTLARMIRIQTHNNCIQ